MFEGVIHHLGEKLFPGWNEPRQREGGRRPQPALFREPLDDRDKMVRARLGLDNGGEEYQATRALIRRLVDFRDSFAHPKEHRQDVADEVVSELEPLPEIAWEVDLQAEQVRTDFEQIENYCRKLLDAASGLLSSTYAKGWNEWQKEFPHLRNVKIEAAYLPGFLHTTSHSSLDYSR